MIIELKPDDRLPLRMLRLGNFELRRGGWRFGTARIGNTVIARLLANGAAVRHGNQIWLSDSEAAR